MAELKNKDGSRLSKNPYKKNKEKTRYRTIDGLEKKTAQAKSYMLKMAKEGIVEVMTVRVSFGTNAVKRKVYYIKDMESKEKVEEWKTVEDDNEKQLD